MWPETDFRQHTNGIKSRPSTLDLWELIDPTISSETLFAQTQSKPINYKEKILTVRQTGSSGRTLTCFKKRLLEKFTWRAEAALNADLRSKEDSILLVTKTLLNLGDGLDSLGHPLGKVVKPQVALVGLQGIETRKLLWSRGSHLSFCEQDEEPDHVSPSIGHHLEHHQLVERRMSLKNRCRGKHTPNLRNVSEVVTCLMRGLCALPAPVVLFSPCHIDPLACWHLGR